MGWEILESRPESSGGFYSQMSPAWRTTATDPGRRSGRYTPEELAAKAVAANQGPRSKSRSQPPAEVGDQPAQRVEERPLQCDTRIPRSRRTIAVEYNQAGDESSYSVFPCSPRGDRSLRFWESRSPGWQSGDCFSRWPILRSRQLMRWLAWDWGLTSRRLPWGGSGSHQGSQGHQGSGPERYPEQGIEASTTASGITSGPDF